MRNACANFCTNRLVAKNHIIRQKISQTETSIMIDIWRSTVLKSWVPALRSPQAEKPAQSGEFPFLRFNNRSQQMATAAVIKQGCEYWPEVVGANLRYYPARTPARMRAASRWADHRNRLRPVAFAHGSGCLLSLPHQAVKSTQRHKNGVRDQASATKMPAGRAWLVDPNKPILICCGRHR